MLAEPPGSARNQMGRVSDVGHFQGSDRGAVNGPLDEARADEAPVVAVTEGRGPGRD